MISDTTRTAVTAALLRLAADVAEGTADWEQVGSFVLFHHRAETVTVTASTAALHRQLATPSEGREGYEARKRAAKAPRRVCSGCGVPAGFSHLVGCPMMDRPA